MWYNQVFKGATKQSEASQHGQDAGQWGHYTWTDGPAASEIKLLDRVRAFDCIRKVCVCCIDSSCILLSYNYGLGTDMLYVGVCFTYK